VWILQSIVPVEFRNLLNISSLPLSCHATREKRFERRADILGRLQSWRSNEHVSAAVPPNFAACFRTGLEMNVIASLRKSAQQPRHALLGVYPPRFVTTFPAKSMHWKSGHYRSCQIHINIRSSERVVRSQLKIICIGSAGMR
jgi:hypothetical protein